MFIHRLFFSLFLASYATAIDKYSNHRKAEENHRPLRAGRSDDTKESIIPSELGIRVREDIEHVRELSFGDEAVEIDGEGTVHDVKHRIIFCKDGEEELACKKRILDTIPTESRESFRINNYLNLIHAFAVELNCDESVLDPLKDEVFDDPPRETMHIKESIEVHRNLQGQSIPYGIAMVKAMDVWKTYNNKGENVRVCVMDTGINRDHPDLDEDRLFGYDGNELVQPWYRDVDGHGTHVSGTIAASDNNQGVVGVAPGAEIFTARVFSTNGRFYSSNIITALQACKDGGAKVISMSLGGPYAVSYERQAYTDLHEKFGIVTVAASGNTGGTQFLYPASYNNVISVGSVNWNYDRSSFSTRNSKVDVAAPGSSVVSHKS